MCAPEPHTCKKVMISGQATAVGTARSEAILNMALLHDITVFHV